MDGAQEMDAAPFSLLCLPFSHNREESRFEKLFYFLLRKIFVPRVTFTVAYFPLLEVQQHINQPLL